MRAAKHIDWDCLPLGKEPDKVIAQLVGCTRQAVYYARRQRGVPSPAAPRRPHVNKSAIAHVVGSESDKAVAERHGLTAQQVARARRALGVVALRGQRLHEAAAELGTAPDLAIAQKYGIDNSLLSKFRRKHGLRGWCAGRRCPCGQNYVAVNRRQRFCSSYCRRYHWHMVKCGVTVDVADLRLALRSYKNTMQYGVGNNYTEIEMTLLKGDV